MELKRIITSNKYIKELDGLRFLAIFLVLIFHISRNVNNAFNNNIDKNNLELFEFISNLGFGALGVNLFFVISGFILGLPFIKSYTSNDKLNLINYYKRRLTRLEPPYILIMTMMAFVFVFIKGFGFLEILKHYLASLLYCHFLFYPGEMPLLNGVAWSLEIEIQFYLLTPFICKIFYLKKIYRRSLLIMLIIFFALLDFHRFNFGYLILLYHIHYFFIGYLLADLYLNRNSDKKVFELNNLISMFILLLIVIPDIFKFGIYFHLLRIILIFILYYQVLFNQKLSFIFKNTFIAISGGMCYTIYLIHIPIIGVINMCFKNLKLAPNHLNVLIYIIVCTISIGILSILYYSRIERPCMNPNWISNLKFFKK